MQQEVFERQWRIRDGEVWICAFPMTSEKSVVSEERLASGKHESKEGNETVTQTDSCDATRIFQHLSLCMIHLLLF
jgi:hypothetical protein